MGLYKLVIRNKDDLSKGYLEKTTDENVDYEKDFENWLENSPDVLLEEEGETVLWIGRQVKISAEGNSNFPDLLGVDSSGDLIIVELKKGRTPRDVIAQVLEYSAWIDTLNYDEINEIAVGYFKEQNTEDNRNLLQAYQEVFLPDEEIAEESIDVDFNDNQKLFIVAEEITPAIRQVTAHLRAKYQMKIFCIEYKVQKTEQGEFFLSIDRIGGYEELGLASKKKRITTRWNHPVKIKNLIYDAVKKITGGSSDASFSAADVYKNLKKDYPEIKSNTVTCQVIQDCVNHTSRKHYPGGQQDLYFRIEKGVFRLYDSKKDGNWNSEGQRID